MIIDSDFKPHLCASKESTRPVLNGVFFSKEKGLLIATDGRMIAYGSIREYSDDQEGIIPTVAFKEAHKIARNHAGIVSIAVKDGCARLLDGRTFPLVDGTFPNWEEVLPKLTPKRVRMLINPALLYSVYEALGGNDREGALIEFEIDEQHDLTRSPVSVKVAGREGCFMPMRIEPRAEAQEGAFIVRAVNANDTLIKALEDIRAEADYVAQNGSDSARRGLPGIVWRKASEALAAAQEEAPKP